MNAAPVGLRCYDRLTTLIRHRLPTDQPDGRASVEQERRRSGQAPASQTSPVPSVKSVPGSTMTVPRIAPQRSKTSSTTGTIAATGRLCLMSRTRLVLPCATSSITAKHFDLNAVTPIVSSRPSSTFTAASSTWTTLCGPCGGCKFKGHSIAQRYAAVPCWARLPPCTAIVQILPSGAERPQASGRLAIAESPSDKGTRG